MEASWAWQESELVIGTAAGSAPMFDVHVDQLQGSFVFQLGAAESRLRPFLAAGVGAAFFSASDLESQTMREGAVHSGVRKARDAGASLAETEQVVALAASTIGFPASVAVWTWVREEAGTTARPKRPRHR